MMNFIGKGLVLIYTFLSLMALALSLLVYFEFVDWGRSTPRADRGEVTKGGGTGNDLRVASEYDKSVVVYNDAAYGRNLIVPTIPPVEAALHESEARLWQNHLYYVAELDRLRKGEGPIEIKEIAAEGIPTDTPGKKIGKPIPEVPAAGLDRSVLAYQQILKEEQAKLDPLEKAVGELAEKNSDVSYKLTGKNAQGKKDTHGLIELRDQEFQTQQRLKEERDYLQPQWATAVEEARRFGARRSDLETQLSRLEKAVKERQSRQK